MFKKLGITGLALAAALTVLGSTASAEDRDDYRYHNAYGDGHERHEREEWRERERHERREREWREHERREHRGERYYNGYYGNDSYGNDSYGNGYYDGYGYWHPYR